MDIVHLLLALLGGLGVFLIGMNMMSESMSHLSHGKLRTMLNKTTSNRFAGVGVGTIVTAIIQSSSATTVMVVGLVNAGVMTLLQATSVIMGANIGTTITAHIANLGNIPIADFFYLCAIIGVFTTMLGKSEKVKMVGNILGGIGLIFVGLDFMSEALSFSNNEGLKNAFISILEYVKHPVLLLLIGALITGIVQSSSAVTSLIIILASAGAVIGGADTDGAYFVIIGSNIGTCVTALLSSIGTSVNARRAALIHLMFNLFGAIIFSLFLFIWRWTGSSFSGTVLNKLFPDDHATQIAVFHTLFNVVCTSVFLGFVKVFVWIAEHLIRDKENKNGNTVEPDISVVLDERLLLTPAVAIERCHEKTLEMSKLAASNVKESIRSLWEYSAERANSIRDAEIKIDRYEDAICSYLVKLSAHQLGEKESIETAKYLKLLGDLERISDHSVNVLESVEELREKSINFSETALADLQNLCNAIEEILCITVDAFERGDLKFATTVEPLEEVIDVLRKKLRNDHIVRLQQGNCTLEAGFIWSDLLTNLERVSDHCSNVAGCIIDAQKFNLNIHETLSNVKSDDFYKEQYDKFKEKYLA